MKANKTIDAFYVMLAAILWSTMGVFSRHFNSIGLHSFEIAQLRITIGLLCVGGYLLIFHRDMFKIKFRDIWCFIGTGIISLLFFSCCYFTAIELTSLATAGVLLYTAPTFVMVMSLFLFKEKLSLNKVAALILSFVGCILVSGLGGQSVNAFGIIMGLGSGFFYALNAVLFERFFRKDGPLVAFTALQFTATALLLYPATAIADGFSLAMPPETLRSLLPVVLYMSLGASVLGWGLRNYVLTHLDARHYSVLAALGPVVTSAMSAIFGFETLGWHFLVGAVLITGAVILDTLWTTPPPPKAEEKGRPHDLYEG